MCKTEALIGYNLTDANSMMNQYDSDVKSSSLKKLINYVCGFSVVSGLSCYLHLYNFITAHCQYKYQEKFRPEKGFFFTENTTATRSN